MRNSKNASKLGFASQPYADGEDDIVAPYVPPAPAPAVNPVAQAVVASLGAQSLTGGNAAPGTPPAKVIFFADDEDGGLQAYKAPAAVVEEPPVKSNWGVYLGGGLVAFALWRLFR